MNLNTATQPQGDRATLGDLVNMPARMTLPIAGRYFGLGKSSAYALNSRGEFPVEVLQVGERFYVRGVDVARALGVDVEEILARSFGVGSPAAGA